MNFYLISLQHHSHRWVTTAITPLPLSSSHYHHATMMNRRLATPNYVSTMRPSAPQVQLKDIYTNPLDDDAPKVYCRKEHGKTLRENEKL